ncbi:unnamed protein product [Paramecium sonneborni]|uniref:t-SNARE coiled-coil homology domain-containing protein n=1 Tax=Paramecium sonneborni TaxID=65129 RepID=A0A8S1PQV0_9CILI|nr:unnamed protein product [Paramecium sonneborni]
MEDCLFEIKGAGSQYTIQKQIENDVQSEDQNIVINDNDNNDELMPLFKVNVVGVQRILETIKSNIVKIEELKKEYISATKTDAEKDVSMKLDKIIQQNNQQQDRMKRLMEQIAQDVEEAKEKEPNEPETRMKMDIWGAVNLKAQTVLQESQKVQLDFKNSMRNKIKRQAGCLDSNLNEEQVEELCEDPNKLQELLQKKIYGQASIQLQNAVQDIQDKYQDILKLERSVQQVYQLFADMAVLVKNQGELIDNIEQNMIKAKDYVKKGEAQQAKAKKAHQAARKKMCCIIMIGLVLILVIVGPIMGTSL